MEKYNVIAKNYAKERTSSHIGIDELQALLEKLPHGAQILDFGAGTGKPLTKFIAEHSQHFKVFAMDSSLEMLHIFRANVPQIPIEHASILDVDFFSETFDAIVSWGVMFHLTEVEQRRAIERVASALNKGGFFLFTSGKEAGRRHGIMFEVEFLYYSLGSAKYREVLAEYGMTMVSEHFGEGENYYYLAQKL
jgi:cyclopropane fatty-acyl-phospholipid synthase-like methyltransferase